MSNHIIFDFETLATTKLHNATVLDVSAFAFRPARMLSTDPYTFEEVVEECIRVKFSVADQKRNYRTGHDQGAIDFWQALPKEERDFTFAASKIDLTLRDGIIRLLEYIEMNNVSFWWSRSNMFDPVVLEGQCEKLGLTDRYKQALNYGKVRDTRSFIDGFFGFNTDTGFVPAETDEETERFKAKFEQHRSSHDIAADVLRIQLIERTRANI